MYFQSPPELGNLGGKKLVKKKRIWLLRSYFFFQSPPELGDLGGKKTLLEAQDWEI
jgi:hypothetical protein